MQISDPSCQDVRDEIAVLKDVLNPPAARGRLCDVLEIGCGTGDITRRMADTWPDAQLCALEVDAIQLKQNQLRNRHRNIRYMEGPAENIPFQAQTFDAVLMFKSLHHVPSAQLDRALDEVLRVLRPGAWPISPNRYLRANSMRSFACFTTKRKFDARHSKRSSAPLVIADGKARGSFTIVCPSVLLTSTTRKGRGGRHIMIARRVRWIRVAEKQS